MEALSSPGRSDPQHSVVGLGSNLFRQIRQGCNQDKETLDLDHDADEIVIGPVACVGIDAQHQAILGVVAANWSQIIFRSARPDSLIARGYDYQSLQLHLDRICAQPCNDSKDRTVIAWLGEDAFTAYIDTDGLLQQLAPVSNASEGPRRIHGLGPWRTAAMDKRGRIVAIDLAGNAYLFASVSEMMAAANAVDSAELEDLQHRYRFAFPGAPDSRPVFTAVVAGWAHFVLVADSAIWPLWALGDTRFGVVPMPPRLSTAAKGAAGRLDGREERPDEELLVPLEFFSRFRAGFPTSVAQVACGGRHVLVRTDSGDVYGWGWNGQGQICRLQQQPGGVHDEALTQPVLVELPVQRGQAEPVIVDIACGSDHSVLVGQHGELWIAGSSGWRRGGRGRVGTMLTSH
ncbi:uncharacterized protein PSFLO_05557 [Pseudozyma flocculosa]|uniref:Uncharacterized protein n=1 Tax=Pseudozyma flocculosa TaxID=84751 RepID=A0A5C3F8U0_9BASI|nr:uncharacterized protein PSFLO_05557 [Pseudozyma flocculosa]